ncbi:MAG: ABC transporter permease subunit, partial [Chloroflexota bacterium]
IINIYRCCRYTRCQSCCYFSNPWCQGGIIAYPFIQALYLSFTRTIGLVTGPFVGMDNYMNVWSDRFFWESVWITTQYTFWAVVLKFIAGMIAAILLHRMKRFGAIFTGLVLLPWIMPVVIRAITWKGLLDPLYGMVSKGLVDLGLSDQAIPFFGDPDLALPAVIMVNLWAGIPFFTILLVAGLKAISKELYEAASIDGASAWRQFLHITLPGLKYVIIVETLLSTIWTFNNFGQIFLLTGGGPIGATKVYSVLVYEAFSVFRVSTAVAIAMSMTPILFVLILILGQYMMKGNRREDVVDEENRGILLQALYTIAWPLRMAIRLLVMLFWVVNDIVEAILGAIFGAIGRTFFKADDPKTHARNLRWRKTGVTWFAGVTLMALLAFELLPFYWVITTSFKSDVQTTTFTSLYWPEPWTAVQYETLFGPTRNFLSWFQNTIIVSLATPLVSVLVASFGAYGLVRLKWKGSSMVSSIVLVAYLMPPILLVISIYQIFSTVGLVNNLQGLVVAYTTFSLPFAIWLMMGYYATIPEELEQAGLIDGCNRFQVFFRIVLPLTKPALMAIFLFGVTNAWNEFLFAFILISSERLMTLPVGLGQMIIGDVLPWGELTAAAVITFIPVFLIYTVGQRFMVEGLAAGAVKA